MYLWFPGGGGRPAEHAGVVLVAQLPLAKHVCPSSKKCSRQAGTSCTCDACGAGTSPEGGLGPMYAQGVLPGTALSAKIPVRHMWSLMRTHGRGVQQVVGELHLEPRSCMQNEGSRRYRWALLMSRAMTPASRQARACKLPPGLQQPPAAAQVA